MDDFDTLLVNSMLPCQLKEYFGRSIRMKEILKVDTIREIEDVYIFYDSLYTFNSSEFSSFVVSALKNCTNSETFYDYLITIMDKNLVYESKTAKAQVVDHHFSIDPVAAKTVFREVFNDYIKIVDAFYKHELDNVSLVQTYKNIGKMELINVLIDDKNYKHLLSVGKDMLSRFIRYSG